MIIDFSPTPPKIDPTVDWIPMSIAKGILKRHPSQIRRDRAVLERLELIDYTARSGGFSRDTFRALWIFRQLVEQRGRKEAIKAITDYLEKYRHE